MNRTGLKYSTLIAALIFSQVALSADEERLIEDYFSMRWFETEIIIFERPDVTETNTPEQLLVSDARSYPRDVRSLEVDASSYFQLDPMTQLCLAPTTLSYTVTPLEAILDEAQAMFEEDFPGELADEEIDSDDPAASGIADLEVPVISPSVAIIDAFQRFLNRIGDLEVSFAQKSYQYLPEAQLQLRAQAGRLVQRQGVRVLMHERWLQPVPPRDQPEPLLVQRDLRLGQLHLLEGTLAVTIGRYLHLQANLWYQVPGLGAEPVDIAFPPDGSASADLSASAFEHAGYMALSESRRTRSGELHYLDHPRLGVIVRIDPVAIPADVLESFEALKELP